MNSTAILARPALQSCGPLRDLNHFRWQYVVDNGFPPFSYLVETSGGFCRQFMLLCEELWVSTAAKLSHSTALWFCAVGSFAMFCLLTMIVVTMIKNHILTIENHALKKKQEKDGAENHNLTIKHHALKKKQAKDSTEIRTLKDEKHALKKKQEQYRAENHNLTTENHALKKKQAKDSTEIRTLKDEKHALKKKQAKDSTEIRTLKDEKHALKKKQAKDSTEIRTLKDEKQIREDAFEKEARTSPYKVRKVGVYNEGISNMNQTKSVKFMKDLDSPKSKSKMTHCPEIGSTNQSKIESAGFDTLMAVIGVYMSMDQKGRTSQDRNDRFISWLAELGIRADRRNTITHCIAEETKLRFAPLQDK